MTEALEAFRAEVRCWLQARLAGEFAELRGVTRQADHIEALRCWEAALGDAGLSCIGWPVAYGGGGASIAAQLVFGLEYAAAKAPPRLGHLGVELLGPTLIAFGTEAQKQRLLPPIRRGQAIWCQGYSEPNAGSDLANVRTQARLLDGKWRVNGQKIWTSWGLWADRIFVLARSEAGRSGPAGLSFLLLDMNQPGVVRRPIRQMTGESEFAEVFFDDAEADEEDLVGVAGQGWTVAMALLGFERGVSTLVQQMHFANEFALLVEATRANGSARDPLIRQKIAEAWTGLQIMKFNALRLLSDTRSGELDGAALTSKLYWSRWHRGLGDLAMEILGVAGEVGIEGYSFGALADMHLQSRADTIYAGSSQIQRNIIAERGLGLPKEPRGAL